MPAVAEFQRTGLEAPRYLSQATRNRILVAAMDVHNWAKRQAAAWPTHYDQDLGGLCVIASRRLFRELLKLRLKPKLVYFHDSMIGHSYICIAGHILDVTATQFDCRQVEFFPARTVHTLDWWWQVSSVFRTERAFVARLRRDEVPEVQIALPYQIKRES